MENNFIESLQKLADSLNPNISVTENGAVGYQTTGKSLLDMNFMLSSMRNWSDDDIWAKFLKAYNDNPDLAVVWLFFARDARGGCGERRTFRVIISRLASENPDLVIKLLPLIPEYGRWDDVIEIYFSDAPCKVRDAAFSMISRQIQSDILCANTNQPVSLLGKWMPSISTSSKESCRRAETLRTALKWGPKQYRKNLSGLRKCIKVVEQQMSANEWGSVNYESVPSKAGMIYRDAFSRHDGERYDQYLDDVKSGKANMNASVIFPYEIVHAYMDEDVWSDSDVKAYDETLELKWKNLPGGCQNGSTLVVVDGSGSMGSRIGGTSITCHDVARSLGIYFAERLTGPYKNSIITFSSSPKFVRFNGVETLNGKISILEQESDCSNTNLEKTFDLILQTAVENHLKQDELPTNVLIISDMEFDSIKSNYSYALGRWVDWDERLFDVIGAKFAAHGYKLPRLVFWNVCSRSETIPVKENEMGVALVSGFSQNIADMVMSGELDPWKLLINKLRDSRYDPIWKVVMPS